MLTTLTLLMTGFAPAGETHARTRSLTGPGPVIHLNARADAPHGYLWTFAPGKDGVGVKTAIPYEPREGDILFFDDMSKLWTQLYRLADTAPPFHAGVVVKRSDGTLAVLEAGPDDTFHVYMLDIQPRLFGFKGVLQVRRAKRALTPEQSAALTAFAEAQNGKRYALWRLLIQGTPFKTKGGPLRRQLAYTMHNRTRWLCAEIAIVGAGIAGLADLNDTKGSSTYPLDIIDDTKHDLSASYHPAGYWAPHP